MSFPRYPAYQDSKLEWAKTLPEHWTAKHLKRNARLLTEKTDTRQYPVGLENLEGWTGRFMQTESDFQGEGVAFKANDILFGKLRPYLAKAWLADRSGEAIGDFHVLRPFEGVIPRFIQYQLLTREVIDLVDGSTYGAKMPRASWGFLGCLELPTPPTEEQLAIASFLDRETAKIDTLIAEQQRLIELLQEKRQAVISHAVTKGLNPNAPMKNSGVEWLGEVPEHWEVKKASWLFRTEKGKKAQELTQEYCATNEGPFPVFSGQTKDGGVMGGIDSYEFDAGDAGAILCTTVGAKAMSIRRITGRFSLSQNCMVISPKTEEVTPVFFEYGFQPLFKHERALIPDHMQPSFRMEDFNQFWVQLPPVEEQVKISKYLQQENEVSVELEAEISAAIDLLQERRSALISAAVTGQIDVRGLATEEET